MNKFVKSLIAAKIGKPIFGINWPIYFAIKQSSIPAGSVMIDGKPLLVDGKFVIVSIP